MTWRAILAGPYAAGLMNFPLLRTVFLVKRLDDSIAHATQMVREAQMRLVELPLDPGAPGAGAGAGLLLHSALMHKADRLAQHWESQDLGIAVNVLGLGKVALNVTLVISICVATLPMLWESARLFEFGPGRGGVENEHSTDVDSTNRVRASV